MGLIALVASLGGAAYLGFAHWHWLFLVAWASAWALAFLFDNRGSMRAAIADRRVADDPRAIAILSYATTIAGVVALFIVGESAVFYLSRGASALWVEPAGGFISHTAQFTPTVSRDAAAPWDPYVYCAGFLLTALGLMLSQVHRDEGILLPWRVGLPFNLLRKTASLMLLICMVRGFWIVGPWWILFVPLLVVSSLAPFYLIVRAKRRLTAIFLSISVGLAAVSWAQAGPG